MMNTTNLTMKQEKKRNKSNYSPLFEIKTKAKTEIGVCRVLKKNVEPDFYNNDEEELHNLINSDWITVCKDGIIIWEDMVL